MAFRVALLTLLYHQGSSSFISKVKGVELECAWDGVRLALLGGSEVDELLVSLSFSASGFTFSRKPLPSVCLEVT